MRWPPQPEFPPDVLAVVTHEVMQAKNTTSHLDAQRVAREALAAAAKALATLPADALQALGLVRL